jgi:dihydroxyacetone kinase
LISTQVPADKAWCDAYVAFAEAITKCGGAGIGSRTMCDATLPAADVFRTGGTLAEAAAAARKGADSTASLAATHGRSAYLAEETQRGVVDPGARAVAIAFAAVASA